jgi:tartronate-semialdehyde synthase
MEAFGALGKRVERPEDIKPALAWAVEQSNRLKVPALVEIRVERETAAAMGASIDKIIEREPVIDLPAEAPVAEPAAVR